MNVIKDARSGARMPWDLPEVSLLEIVEMIYSAAFNSELWQDVAARCHRLVPGSSFSLLAKHETDHDIPMIMSAGWDPDYLLSYMEHYHKLNTYDDFLQSVPTGKIVRASEIVPREWRESQVFYQEWLRPQGNYVCGAQVTLSRSSRSEFTRVSYDIPEKLTHEENKAAGILRRIGPHLRTAFAIRVALCGASASMLAFDALLDRIRDPAVAVGEDRRILLANGPATVLLAKGSTIKQSSFTRLQFVGREAEDAFQQTFKEFLVGAEPTSRSFTIRVGEEPRVVHVLPLRISQPMGTIGASTPIAIVVIPEPRSAKILPIGILHQAFRLSEREARVVLLVADGLTVTETAAKLGVSVSTVRNQLSSAMSKLGVHRRADLATLVTGLVPSLKVD